MDLIGQAATLLHQHGPYAVMAFMGWYLWKQNTYIQKLHGQLLEMMTNNTAAMTGMGSLLTALKDAINNISMRLK